MTERLDGPQVPPRGTAGGPASRPAPRPAPRSAGRLGPPPTVAVAFLLPGAAAARRIWVVYPIVYSIFRSLFDAAGNGFVGARATTRRSSATPASSRRSGTTSIWVVGRADLVTALGLIFAVLTERIRWATAFKLIVFMPMAVSLLAAGVIFRLVYEQDPDKGVANAVLTAVHDTFSASARATRAPGRARATSRRSPRQQTARSSPSSPRRPARPVLIPLVGVKPRDPAGRGAGPPAAAAGPRRAHRHRLARLHPRRRRHERRRGRHREGPARHDGRGGAATARSAAHRHHGRRRHLPLRRPGPRAPTSYGCRSRTSTRAYNGLDLARPDARSPRRSSARTSGCGPASRWC